MKTQNSSSLKFLPQITESLYSKSHNSKIRRKKIMYRKKKKKKKYNTDRFLPRIDKVLHTEPTPKRRRKSINNIKSLIKQKSDSRFKYQYQKKKNKNLYAGQKHYNYRSFSSMMENDLSETDRQSLPPKHQNTDFSKYFNKRLTMVNLEEALVKADIEPIEIELKVLKKMVNYQQRQKNIDISEIRSMQEVTAKLMLGHPQFFVVDCYRKKPPLEIHFDLINGPVDIFISTKYDAPDIDNYDATDSVIIQQTLIKINYPIHDKPKLLYISISPLKKSINVVFFTKFKDRIVIEDNEFFIRKNLEVYNNVKLPTIKKSTEQEMTNLEQKVERILERRKKNYKKRYGRCNFVKLNQYSIKDQVEQKIQDRKDRQVALIDRIRSIKRTKISTHILTSKRTRNKWQNKIIKSIKFCQYKRNWSSIKKKMFLVGNYSTMAKLFEFLGKAKKLFLDYKIQSIKKKDKDKKIKYVKKRIYNYFLKIKEWRNSKQKRIRDIVYIRSIIIMNNNFHRPRQKNRARKLIAEYMEQQIWRKKMLNCAGAYYQKVSFIQTFWLKHKAEFIEGKWQVMILFWKLKRKQLIDKYTSIQKNAILTIKDQYFLDQLQTLSNEKSLEIIKAYSRQINKRFRAEYIEYLISQRPKRKPRVKVNTVLSPPAQVVAKKGPKGSPGKGKKAPVQTNPTSSKQKKFDFKEEDMEVKVLKEPLYPIPNKREVGKLFMTMLKQKYIKIQHEAQKNSKRQSKKRLEKMQVEEKKDKKEKKEQKEKKEKIK